jgi:hypothetical protein
MPLRVLVVLYGYCRCCFGQVKNLFDFKLEETAEDGNAFELGDWD